MAHDPSSEGDKMSRIILVVGALLWATVAVVALVSIVSGDWLTPALMTIAGIAFIAVRRSRRVAAQRATGGSPSW
jgi:hypothetical protein